MSITLFTAATPKEKDYPFPRIDGSTSTVTLDAAIRAYYSGKSVSDEYYAYNPDYYGIKHSKTFESFEKLIAGEVDLVLSVPLSKEQREIIPKNFKLVEEKIALEGFVFLLNPENPVKSLTSEQIRDIYSGKITNWKEVGGDDAEIIAYQRNTDSGSQTYMTEFMGETKLAAAPKERISGEMGHMITLLSAYDNSKYAIGYSVYTYAAEKQANAANITLLAVDGVAPSRETFTDKSYPLLSATYAFYNAKNENPRVKEIVDFLITEDGQKVIADSGYYPVLALKTAGTPYAAKGTGKAKPEDYKPVNAFSRFRTYDLDDDKDVINCLSNEKLVENIKAFLAEQPEDYDPWIDVRNGYISLGSDGKSVIFDMFTGERVLKFSDLFYKDADFVPVLNEMFADWNGYRYDDTLPPKADFIGFLEEPEFDLNSYSLQDDNAYYFDYASAPYYNEQNDSLLDMMVLYEYRDISECFLPEYRKYIEKADWLPYYTEEGIWIDGDYYYQVESRYEDVKTVNKQLIEACKSFYAAEYFPEDERDLSDGWQVVVLKNCFQFHNGGMNIYIDRKTGKVLTLSDIFKKGFTAKMMKLNPGTKESLYNDNYCFRFYLDGDGKITIYTSTLPSATISATVWFDAYIIDIKSKYADIPTDSYMSP
jgi:ABC-type phosphate transport system substrate-binding protein